MKYFKFFFSLLVTASLGFIHPSSEVKVAFGPLIPLAIAGLSALGGALGNRESTQKTTSESSGTSTTTPNLDPATLDFRNLIIHNYLKQLTDGLDLTGYRANAITDINRVRQLQQQRLREQLASRGIFGPAAELAIANVDNDRFKDITQLNNSIPLLRQQLSSDITSRAGQFFSSIPYGSTITSSQKGSGTQTMPGNPLAGGIGGGASALAYLFGQGAFNGNRNMLSGTGG